MLLTVGVSKTPLRPSQWYWHPRSITHQRLQFAGAGYSAYLPLAGGSLPAMPLALRRVGAAQKADWIDQPLSPRRKALVLLTGVVASWAIMLGMAYGALSLVF